MTQRLFSAAWALMAISVTIANAADWPQWGGGPSRNPVSLEKGLTLDFQFRLTDDKDKVVKEERGITWKAELGSQTVIPPVIADGLIWVGTNVRQPDDDTIPSKDWDGGVLKCFRESDGKLLWQHRTPRLSGKGVFMMEDFPQTALGSAPLVDGDRLWYVNNRSEVVCYDIAPLKKGTGPPAELWKLDMRKELGVVPHLPMMQRGFAASVAEYKDKLYVVTHNGIDENHTKVVNPDAPSLICLEKASGKVVWKDNSPGKEIIEHQISSPLVVEIHGKPQVIVGQGDGWLRAFDALTGMLIWKCDLNSKDAVWKIGGGDSDRNYVVATPILYDGRIYVATGLQVEAFVGPAALYCIDPTKTGDVSRELDAGPKLGKPNPNSAVIWYTPKAVPEDAPRILVGAKKHDRLRSRDFYFGRSIAGCVAHDGLVYATDVGGFLFCFDAKTGKLYWCDDLLGTVRGQLLWVDGKVLAVTDSCELFAFAHGKVLQRLSTVEASSAFYAGPVFANGTLFLTTENTLFAIRKPK